MSKYDKLKKQSENAFAETQKVIGHRDEIADEIKRVSDIAYNAGMIISDIDKKFAQATKLNNVDISFLFLAAALQCARWYFIDNESFRFDAHNQGDKFISTFVPKKWESILLQPVPYDAIKRGFELKDAGIKLGLGGNTHRYQTLGHDPVMGWVFGTMNILSDSLTKTDFITTYKVSLPYIVGNYPGGTLGAFQVAGEQASANKLNLPAAVARQALHFGSDYFTKQGLPFPFISSVSQDFSKQLLTKFNIDMWSITRSATLAAIINKLIACIHRLFYNEAKDGISEIYEVRTRKVLSYSNALATGLNTLYVFGTEDWKKLDAGGILVTLWRLVSDYNFIQKIKQEFIEKEWTQLVIGDNFDF